MANFTITVLLLSMFLLNVHSVNVCSSRKWQRISDGVLGLGDLNIFESCCKVHDNCYEDQRPRNLCDDGFNVCTNDICDQRDLGEQSSKQCDRQVRAAKFLLAKHGQAEYDRIVHDEL